MLKAIIFDNDGVLVDSEPLHHLAEQATVAQLGYEITEQDFMQYVGVSSKIMLTGWIEKFQLNITLEELGEIHEKNLMRQFKTNLQPTSGIIELLNNLKKQPLKLAVASSSTGKLVRTGLEKVGFYDHFETIVCGDEVEEAKPDPIIYLKTAGRLNVQPDECIVIEDSFPGVTAARAAGMFCIGYKNANSGDQDLSRANYIITHFDELTNGKLKEIYNSLFI